MISRKTKYALQALNALAQKPADELVLIADLAKEEKLPKKFLELILLELKNAGILKSRQGKGGGYQLAKPAKEITYGQVIRLFEGPLALTPCASQSAYERCEECVNEAVCGIKFVMKDVREAMAKVLDSVTIQDSVVKSQEAKQKAAGVLVFDI